MAEPNPQALWDAFPLKDAPPQPSVAWSQSPWLTTIASREATPATPPTFAGDGLPLFILAPLIVLVVLATAIASYAIRLTRRPLPVDELGEADWTTRNDNMFGGGR